MRQNNLWTATDSARFSACEVYTWLRNGQPLRPVAPTRNSFRPQFSTTEFMLASGPFELLEYSGLGNGSYIHHGGMAIGSPLFTAAFFASQAIANSANRNAAAQAAIPRWHVTNKGLLTVSTSGFYLEEQAGLFAWDVSSINSLEVIAESAVLMRGQSTQGSVSWIIHSDWAELIFVIWAAAMHPQHPQFSTGAFISSEWVNKVHANGYVLPGEATATPALNT